MMEGAHRGDRSAVIVVVYIRGIDTGAGIIHGRVVGHVAWRESQVSDEDADSLKVRL